MRRAPYYSPYAYFAAEAASFAVLRLLFPFLTKPKSNFPKINHSPLEKYQLCPEEQVAYPPDLIPGGRDVPTPYGTIRVHEFGPSDADRKVLFLHGISTPCISLLGIAENLAYRKGCRVMLMDLFGRGWSGGPLDLPYDSRLYASQIFMALASSPLAWTGDNNNGGFALVGYSLGGGLAADFASWFPQLVSELVLIAPGGIMREKNVEWRSRVLYSKGWIPESWLQAAVRRRLRVKPNVSATQKPFKIGKAERGGEEEGLARESADTAPSAELPENAVVSTMRGEVNMQSAVNWQIDNHTGFMPAFMSSIRNAPIHGQHARWRLIGARLDRQREFSTRSPGTQVRPTDGKEVMMHGLNSGKVLILFGADDKIVKPEEVGPDAEAVLGKDNVDIRVYHRVGHEVSIACCDQIADDIWESWSKVFN